MTPTAAPPPSPAGPYKSRLFNLLNRQRWVWRDRLVQAGRRLQMTTVWTGQMILYPLYLLTQLGRGWGLRLEAAISGKRVKLPKTPDELPASDRPIQKTLAQLEELFAEVRVAPTSALALPSATNLIRAIASDRASRNLVLVTAGNQPQDHLSLDQQQQLSQLMLWELSDAAHQQYLLKAKANQYRIPRQLTSDAKVWPPVQRFWQLMVWLQQSPIAMAANVFGEADFAFPPALPPSPPLPPHLPTNLPPWLGQLDGTIATVETCQSYLHSEWQQWWQDQATTPTHRLTRLKQAVQRSLVILLSPHELVSVTEPPLPAPAPWLTWEDLTDPRRDRFAATIPQGDSLIEAEMVIDLALVSPAASESLATGESTHTLPESNLDHPVGEPTPASTTPPTPATASLSTPVMAHPERSQPEAAPLKSVQPEVTPLKSTQPQSGQSESGQLERTSAESPATTNLTRPTETPADPDYQPDWIEVHSEPLGHEEHFLARLLNGFDQVMLVLEEAAIALWQGLKRLLKQVWTRRS
ncbi:MAG: hypothetical protein ACPGVO_22705 [Spirulinaceae cyanobacterium]